MPDAPPSICSHPGCGELVYDGSRCDVHRKQRHRESNQQRPETDRRYGSGRWKKLRAYKLRNDPLCESCKAKGHTLSAVLVDHIRPVRDGGPMWVLNNLQSLCRQCHAVKTANDLKIRGGSHP